MEGKRLNMIEQGPGFKSGIRDFKKAVNPGTIGGALVALAFAYTGPAILAFQAGQNAGFTQAQTLSWVSTVYIAGGLLSFFLGLYYKMPIVGAWSIPGVAMVGQAISGYSFNEAAGAFLIAGILVFLLGITGWVKKIMDWIPLPIVMGMIAGVFMKYGTGIVLNAKADIVVGAVCICAFLITPLITKKIPPVLGSLLFGILAAVVRGQFHFEVSDYGLAGPMLIMPKLNPGTIMSVSIPLAVLVIGAENAQAIGVLKGAGYKVPINAMTIASGIGGIVTSFFGGHNANIAGPMTAIIAADGNGPKEYRYGGAVLNGIGLIVFGVLASYALGIVAGLPSALVSLLAGLAMINILINALKDAFGSGMYKTGAFAAFVIGMSGITILGIGSAFWSLVGGVAVGILADGKTAKTPAAVREG
ncbi:benzoate/H(+) symporter BenE family transporter [Clostridium sp. chh4-2]|uniref:benzoate/H(+) symporter BenE family transporter n=1 Tax=Clostridium sp. chh4-2 TaxID=2067550 RepID=UPI001FA84521|nr:benzoate/H(+) symporter BenE family transporter [Clostridium sp. chh4-2]